MNARDAADKAILVESFAAAARRTGTDAVNALRAEGRARARAERDLLINADGIVVARRTEPRQWSWRVWHANGTAPTPLPDGWERVGAIDREARVRIHDTPEPASRIARGRELALGKLLEGWWTALHAELVDDELCRPETPPDRAVRGRARTPVLRRVATDVTRRATPDDALVLFIERARRNADNTRIGWIEVDPAIIRRVHRTAPTKTWLGISAGAWHWGAADAGLRGRASRWPGPPLTLAERCLDIGLRAPDPYSSFRRPRRAWRGTVRAAQRWYAAARRADPRRLRAALAEVEAWLDASERRPLVLPYTTPGLLILVARAWRRRPAPGSAIELDRLFTLAFGTDGTKKDFAERLDGHTADATTGLSDWLAIAAGGIAPPRSTGRKYWLREIPRGDPRAALAIGAAWAAGGGAPLRLRAATDFDASLSYHPVDPFTSHPLALLASRARSGAPNAGRSPERWLVERLAQQAGRRGSDDVEPDRARLAALGPRWIRSAEPSDGPLPPEWMEITVRPW